MADIEDVPLNRITLALFALNHQIDEGNHLDVNEVRRRVLDGTLFPWLAGEAFGPDGSFAFFLDRTELQTNASLLVLFHDLVGNGWGRSNGPRNSGTALLTAMFIEAIQRKYPIR